MSFCRLATVVCASLTVAASAAGQSLPVDPVTIGNGRLVLAGDANVAIAPEDPGFFNYGSYEHNTLRTVRFGIAAQVHASRRLSVLAEVRSENFEHVTPFALYARVRPFVSQRLDIQVGRIPPTFGRASRSSYQRQNPLIGHPLAYQYLTSLRPDAVPATADELLGMRARGWLSNFSIGNPEPDAGVSLAAASSWDTGVQVTTGWKALTVTGAITSGTLSDPHVRDNNDGRTVAARATVAATPGVEIGASFSRGDFLSRGVLDDLSLRDEGGLVQQAYGLDVEFARGHWQVNAEAVASEWRIPLSGRIEPLRAIAAHVETKYAFLPGFYAAGRLEHLTFGLIQGSAARLEWEAPVTRLEVGVGYYLQRNAVARVSWQVNERDGGRVRSARFVAGQFLFWL